MSRTRRAVVDRETCDLVPIAPGVRIRAAGSPHKGRGKVEVGPDGFALIPREIITPRPLSLRPMAPCPYGEV